MPGTTAEGQAALGDTQAFTHWLQDQARQLAPQPSPDELVLRNGPPPLSITRGGNQTGTVWRRWLPEENMSVRSGASSTEGGGTPGSPGLPGSSGFIRLKASVNVNTA